MSIKHKEFETFYFGSYLAE